MSTEHKLINTKELAELLKLVNSSAEEGTKCSLQLLLGHKFSATVAGLRFALRVVRNGDSSEASRFAVAQILVEDKATGREGWVELSNTPWERSLLVVPIRQLPVPLDVEQERLDTLGETISEHIAKVCVPTLVVCSEKSHSNNGKTYRSLVCKLASKKPTTKTKVNTINM